MKYTNLWTYYKCCYYHLGWCKGRGRIVWKKLFPALFACTKMCNFKSMKTISSASYYVFLKFYLTLSEIHPLQPNCLDQPSCNEYLDLSFYSFTCVIVCNLWICLPAASSCRTTCYLFKPNLF